MLKSFAIGILAAGLIGGVLPQTARAQERQSAEQDSAEALEEARDRLAEARREIEEAAREVAELSGNGRAFYLAGMRGPMRSELGIAIEDVDEGVRVTAVSPGGPAAAAGVEVDDVITAIDSTTLPGAGSESQRLVEHLQNVDPGQTVTLHIERDGAAREIDVMTRESQWPFTVWTGQDHEVFIRGVPGQAPSAVRIGPGAQTWIGPGGGPYSVFLGGRWNDLELVTLTSELGSYFGATEGLLVVRAPDEPRIGLQDGDVIIDIAGRKPTSPEHAMRILMSFEPGETVRFSIMRRQRRETVEYTVPGTGSQG